MGFLKQTVKQLIEQDRSSSLRSSEKVLLPPQNTIKATKMKITDLFKQGFNTGALIGLILFAIIGLLPSSFLGGILGLKIAGVFSSMALLTRIFSAIGMVVGILAAGVFFVAVVSLIVGLCSSFKPRTDDSKDSLILIK